MLDIILGGRGNARCDGVSRRDFLRIGALGGLSLTLPGLLQGQARSAAKNGARAKSVLLVYLGGGLSHHDSFDPKPDAPPEIRGKYKPIDTCVSGLRITEMLPHMAKVMNRLTLVRSGAHNNDHHETATNWVLCGRFGSAFGDYPAMGAVVAHEMGFTGKLPPYVAIPRNPSFTWELGKSAFLGGRYESFKTGDPNAADFKVQDVSPFETLTPKRAQRRQTLLQAVDGLAKQVEGNDQITTYDEFHQRAAAMILSSEARGAFSIEKEPDRLRDRYGRNTFGQSCLLARRLVEGGVRFITINNGGWDHHAKIWDGLGHRLPEFDRGFSALLEDMHERGLLADTLVLVMGEFGRSPKINKDVGRDHWGPAASLLFAGAGVRGGQIVGQTDKQGAYATRRPVAPADVACTVFEALGIDPRKPLMTPDGRPIELLDKGENIKELYA
ncbi:MAG TPA: DUF1501 domain-containing protein [Gemmataceae bacterium]|nr:DUF1501 domain-containing protein [Gemmataceae bacterium]